VPIKPHGRVELVVDERRANQQGLDWLQPLADEAVKAYLSDPRADKGIAQKLSDAWSLRDSLKKVGDQVSSLETEQAELEKSSRETRLSLEAIEKNNQAADLRVKLTKRLAEVTTRLDQITKHLVELRLTLGEAQVRFKEAIRDIKLLGPLPPKD
jgi:chromosome segregation ATPase